MRYRYTFLAEADDDRMARLRARTIAEGDPHDIPLELVGIEQEEVHVYYKPIALDEPVEETDPEVAA